jgi:hypothetical protein
MKDHVIIINSHIDNKAKEDILINCINQLKKTGIDIMISSHTRISSKVLDLVDYYVFDKDNPMITNATDLYNWRNDNIVFKTKTPLSSHSYTALKNVKNAVYFSKSLGKKYFYHIEYDCIISDTDVNTLINLPKENKGYLGYLDVYNLSPSYEGISMLFYYSEVDSFLNITQIPNSVEEYTEYANKHIGGIASEMYLYNRFQDYLGAYKRGERNNQIAISLFDSNKLSLSDSTIPDIEYSNILSIVPNKHKRDEYYLCIVNNTHSNFIQEYIINFNGNEEKITIKSKCIYFSRVQIDTQVKVQIQKHNTLNTIFDQLVSESVGNLLQSEYIEFK